MAENGTLVGARVLRAREGEILPASAPVRDRFMVDGPETGGRFALVQHLFEARALAAPMHRHAREDEFTFVVSGTIGAITGGQELSAGPGDLLVKPRGEWHTFWNAGEEPAVVLEIISPAGLEGLFRKMGLLVEELDPAALIAMAGGFGCEVDFEATGPVVERHGLVF